MHLYNHGKRRIADDRPHGVNIPCGGRRLIKCVSGDTLAFTTTVRVPSTGEPVKKDDLDRVKIYVAVAENRFSPVLWSGSADGGWIVPDEHRPGLVHITVPRTVMNVLRRGAYSFSVVVDDGIVRETQLTGNFQIEYEPTGSINDIPYRNDQTKGAPLSLTPEVDLAAQPYSRLTHEQLVAAVDAVSRAMLGFGGVAEAVYGECGYDPTAEEVDAAVCRLSWFVVHDDALRSKLPAIVDGSYDPTVDEYVDRVCLLLRIAGIGWDGLRDISGGGRGPTYDAYLEYVRRLVRGREGLWGRLPEIVDGSYSPTYDEYCELVRLLVRERMVEGGGAWTAG